MELSADDMARDDARARRKQVRGRARAARRAGDSTDRFQTPQWLERSFVLPLTDRGVTVPHQSQPHHDDFSRAAGSHTPASQRAVSPARADLSAAPSFVRPPSREIDYARMIKRADHCRTAIRTAMAAIGLAGLAVVVFLLTMDPLPLEVAIACTAVAVIAIGVRIRLGTAPVPQLDR